jgi:hypothetical protein
MVKLKAATVANELYFAAADLLGTQRVMRWCNMQPIQKRGIFCIGGSGKSEVKGRSTREKTEGLAVDVYSVLEITLTPALSRSTGRGSGAHRPVTGAILSDRQ